MLRFAPSWCLLFCGILLLPLFLCSSGCSPVEPGAEAAAPASLETDPTMLRALKSIPLIPADGVTGYHGVPFQIEDRRRAIGGYPCSTCHIDPLSELPPAVIDARSMHVNISLDHAGPEVMDCRTCHHPSQLDHLQLQNGDAVPLEQAHRLCGQCHFEQLKDWAGGAHGKRLAGWRGLRAITACTTCHDPHRPAFEEQWPVAYPNLPTVQLSEGVSHGEN